MPKTPDFITKHPLAWLFNPIYRQMHFQNKMCSICFVGVPGSGKSFCAMDWAWALDRGSDGEPRFSIDRVCFSASYFAELIAKDWPKGTAIIMDDAGLNLYSREAMSKTVRQIAKVFQSCRYKNLLIILTLPALSMLDKTVRTLLNAYVEPIEIAADIEKVKAKFHFIQVNPKFGKTYFKRPERAVFVKHPDGSRLLKITQLDNILIDKPPQELVDEYERRKKEYLDDWNKKNVEKVKAFEKDKRIPSLFESHYKLVMQDIKRYLVSNAKGTHVDPNLILTSFPEVGVNNAYSIARLVNKGLKANTILV